MTGEHNPHAPTDAAASVAAAIRFVSGHPDEAEVAAVVAVLQARAALAARAGGAPEKPTLSGWRRPAHVRYAYPRTWAQSRLPR